METNDPVEGWPIRPSVLVAQLEQIQAIVTTWHERFRKEDYVEELDSFRDEIRSQVITQFVNEMKMVTSKAATIVELMS